MARGPQFACAHLDIEMFWEHVLSLEAKRRLHIIFCQKRKKKKERLLLSYEERLTNFPCVNTCVSWSDLNDCVNSKEANKLMHWIVINWFGFGNSKDCFCKALQIIPIFYIFKKMPQNPEVLNTKITMLFFQIRK